jgi:hypothetical protein
MSSSSVWGLASESKPSHPNTGQQDADRDVLILALTCTQRLSMLERPGLEY